MEEVWVYVTETRRYSLDLDALVECLSDPASRSFALAIARQVVARLMQQHPENWEVDLDAVTAAILSTCLIQA